MISMVKTSEYSVGQILEVVPGVTYWEGTALRISKIYAAGVALTRYTAGCTCVSCVYTAPLAGCTCVSCAGGASNHMDYFFEAHEVRPVQSFFYPFEAHEVRCHWCRYCPSTE